MTTNSPDLEPYPQIRNLTVEEAKAAMDAGRLTAVHLTQMYLDRIAALDHAGPNLRSVLEVNPDALAIAAERDVERANGIMRGPLHGIPVLIKDNIDTADSMHTTAGSLALMNSRPVQDATVAAQLRASGAVILGKTNLSEWANMRGRNSCSGWSGRGGFTKNPHCLVRNPSGSSSGSAVAVAADLAMVSLGTETSGSVVAPSSFCGVVGHKPTVGLTSRAGVIPISYTQDTVGVHGRCVADVATTLGTLTGLDPRDTATQASGGVVGTDFLAALDANALRGARLGVPTNFGFMGYSAKADEVFQGALVALAELGAEIVYGTDIPSADALNASPNAVDRMVYEFKRALNGYLAERNDPEFCTLADLIAFNDTHADEELAYFGQELFLASQATEDDEIGMAALSERLNRLSREEGIDAVLREHELDALIAVTKSPAPVSDVINGEKYMGNASNLPAIAGYPIVTVPAGYVQGMPVGLSFIGTAWSDAKLLSLAYAWEHATRMYRSPRFVADDIATHLETLRIELPVLR